MNKIQSGSMVMTCGLFMCQYFYILINTILTFIKIIKNIYWVHLTTSTYEKLKIQNIDTKLKEEKKYEERSLAKVNILNHNFLK